MTCAVRPLRPSFGRTLTDVITDAELAAAIRGHRDWEPLGEAAATYRPPGSDAEVRVRRLAEPRAKYCCSAVQWVGGRSARSLQTIGAGEAVAWAERLRPADG